MPSEPWLFLIDAQGRVAVRYEGTIGLTALDPVVRALAGLPRAGTAPPAAR